MIYSILHTNHANPSPNTQAMYPARQLFMKLTNYDYPVKETFMIFTTHSSNCPQNLSTKVVCKRLILKRIFLYWLETTRNSGWPIITHCIVCLCTADIPVVNFTIKVTVYGSSDSKVSISIFFHINDCINRRCLFVFSLTLSAKLLFCYFVCLNKQKL